MEQNTIKSMRGQGYGNDRYAANKAVTRKRSAVCCRERCHGTIKGGVVSADMAWMKAMGNFVMDEAAEWRRSVACRRERRHGTTEGGVISADMAVWPAVRDVVAGEPAAEKEREHGLARK